MKKIKADVLQVKKGYPEPTRLFDCLAYQLENAPLEDMLSAKEHKQWRKYSTQEVTTIVNQLSVGLLAQGISSGDGSTKGREKVAIISANRPEWIMADLAIQQIGAVSVPVYPTINVHELKFILEDAAVKIVFVGDQNLYKKIASIQIGSYTLTATPYTGSNGTGTTGIPLTRSFTVVDNTPNLSGLTLINAATNKDIGPLANGQIIDLAVTPEINIRANPGTGKVGSVQFSLNSIVNYKTETIVPFAIAGDNGAGDYYKWNIAPGQYTIKAIPYSASNAGGTAGTPISMTITIRKSSTVNLAIHLEDKNQPLQMRVYPNPVTSTTNVAFQLQNDKQVSLTLVNSTGKTMQTIYKGKADAGVLYKKEVNMQNFAKGVYEVILRTSEGKFITQQILLQ